MVSRRPGREIVRVGSRVRVTASVTAEVDEIARGIDDGHGHRPLILARLRDSGSGDLGRDYVAICVTESLQSV